MRLDEIQLAEDTMGTFVQYFIIGKTFANPGMLTDSSRMFLFTFFKI